MCSYFLSQWNLSNPVYYFCQSSEYTERWCYRTNLIVHVYLYSLCTHVRVIRTCTCTHCVLTYGLFAPVPVLTVYSRTGYTHMYLYSLCTHVRVIRTCTCTHCVLTYGLFTHVPVLTVYSCTGYTVMETHTYNIY